MAANLSARAITTSIATGQELLLYRTLDLPEDPQQRVAEIQRSIAVASAYFEDKLGTQPRTLYYAGVQDPAEFAASIGDPNLELSLTEIAARTGAPHPSVYREIQRAEQAGLVTSRKIGNTRLVKANTASPYYRGLAEVLTRAFGVPAVLAKVLHGVSGITMTAETM